MLCSEAIYWLFTSIVSSISLTKPSQAVKHWHCQNQMHFKTQGLLCDHVRDKWSQLSTFCPGGSTACISCCPLESLLKCQFSPTSAWHTNKKQARQGTESTDKHFCITSISSRMSLNFAFNVQLTSYGAYLRRADPTKAVGQVQANLRCALGRDSDSHRQWPQSHFLYPHLQFGDDILHRPSPRINQLIRFHRALKKPSLAFKY